jgi:putative ABC transport system ATP-binding protein
VSLARALANGPRLLLGDEPTANLDSRHGREVMELLRRLAREEGCGGVAVSHDVRLEAIADRVLWLEDGRIRADAGETDSDVLFGASRTGKQALEELDPCAVRVMPNRYPRGRP